MIEVIEKNNTVAVTEKKNQVVVSSTGVQGRPGSEGGTGDFVQFNFNTPAATWSITHSLGHIPLVQLFDADGEQFDSLVECPNNTTVVVTHAIPLVGSVILI